MRGAAALALALLVCVTSALADFECEMIGGVMVCEDQVDSGDGGSGSTPPPPNTTIGGIGIGTVGGGQVGGGGTPSTTLTPTQILESLPQLTGVLKIKVDHAKDLALAKVLSYSCASMWPANGLTESAYLSVNTAQYRDGRGSPLCTQSGIAAWTVLGYSRNIVALCASATQFTPSQEQLAAYLIHEALHLSGLPEFSNQTPNPQYMTPGEINTMVRNSCGCS